MEQQLKDSMFATGKILKELELLKEFMGPVYDEILDNQVRYLNKTLECINICNANRPQISPRYFAACCAPLNDDLLNNSDKLKLITLAVILYSSLTSYLPEESYTKIKDEMTNIGITVPPEVDHKLHKVIAQEKDRIPSIFEIL